MDYHRAARVLLGSGGAAEAVHLKPNVDGIVHVLGYPLYFLTIIGI